MKQKTMQKLIKVLFVIAIILISAGLTLRLLDYHDGIAISIVGLMIGCVALILGGIKNKIENNYGAE